MFYALFHMKNQIRYECCRSTRPEGRFAVSGYPKFEVIRGLKRRFPPFPE